MMKRILALILCLLSLLSMAACAAAPAETTPSTEAAGESTGATEAIDDYPYPQIKEKLSWDGINAFPIKRSDMTVMEMRKLCVDFFRYTKTALWIPNANFKYMRSTVSEKTDELVKGTIYGGLPYIGSANGNIYRLLDYMDPETGVVDIRRATKNQKVFGNQCANGAYWGWGRVINSADYGGTPTMVQANGFLRIGPYTYDDSKLANTVEDGTINVCKSNGEQIMYQSYAQLQPADGLVYYTTAGHVIMCSSVPHVEYVAGTDKIDGEKSYITIIDQSTKFLERTNASGDKFLHTSYVDHKFTFKKLFEDYYLPFTFAEFLGTDPVEDTEVAFSFTGDTITVKELFSSVATANYGISDIYAVVKDSTGKEVYRHVDRAKAANEREIKLIRNGDTTDKWGTLDVKNGEFTVEVMLQLSTGERPVVYSGKLVA